MSIECYIDKYIYQANAFVKKTFDFHIENTNNIDEFSEEFIKDFMADEKFTELNDDLLYCHLAASKAIAQLAWNIYRTHMCHNNECEINEKYFNKIFQNLENKEFYEKQFQNITDKIYDKTSIIDVISRYLIIFCILHHKEVALANIKVCIYCDNEVLENICSICGGDTFNYRNNNYLPIEIMTSNENKSSDKINSNINNENLSCYKNNLLHNENSANSKPNFNSKWYFNSTNEDGIFDQCLMEKIPDYEETETDKINSQSSDTIRESPSPISVKESQLLHNRNCEDSCSFSNNSQELDKELNKKSNSSDCILLRECSLKDNVCVTSKRNSLDNNEDFDKANQINDHQVSELPDVNKDSNIDVVNTDEWVCYKCSFVNNKDDGICAVCLANNQDVKYDFPEEMWICRKCNERNPFDCYKCFKCDNFSDFFNQWVCEKCSYFNDKQAWRCHVCKEDNPHLVKCSECSISYFNQIYDDKCKFCLNKSSINKTYINETLKVTDTNDSLGKQFSQLSINDRRDFQTTTQLNNKITSDINDKKENYTYNFSKDKNCSNKIKINPSYRSTFYPWLCRNPSCHCVNYETVYVCKCYLKNNSYLSYNAPYIVPKDNRELSKWYCKCCEKNYLSLSCSRCGGSKIMTTQL